MPPKEEKKAFKFKIGADPEFTIVSQKARVDARATMEEIGSKTPELRKIMNEQGFVVKGKGVIGWDAANATAELRPNAADTPAGVVENIGALLGVYAKYFDMFDTSTYSDRASIGGHIHFEIPQGLSLTKKSLDEIHNKMASFYLPVMLTEDPFNLQIRATKYGKLAGGYRHEDHGRRDDGSPVFTYEFRVPSAEWLTNPKVATATIAYMTVVYNEILNHPESFKDIKEIMLTNEKQADALQTLALANFEILTRSLTDKIKKAIRKFELYETYKKEVDFIFNPRKVRAEKLEAGYNLLSGWKLLKNQQSKKKDILSKKKFSDRMKDIDLDSIGNIASVYYNTNDTNISLFRTALNSRMAAFKWKLNKQYYVFGLRKGINEIVCVEQSEFITGKELIKTRMDLEAINGIFSRMYSRFINDMKIPNMTYLDYKTGKMKDSKNEVILVGIPYEDRLGGNTSKFIETIWNIENGKVKSSPISKKEDMLLIDDSTKPESERGEIYKAINKKMVETPNVILESGSSSGADHRENMRRVEQDRLREEEFSSSGSL